MATNFSKDEVHEHIYQQGMEALVVDFLQLKQDKSNYKSREEFELWKLIKQKALSKLSQIHDSVCYGEFIAKK